MFETLEITRMAQALAARSGARLALIAENVANADTPGYRARDLPRFADSYAGTGLNLRTTRPGHQAGPMSAPLAAEVVAGSASPDGNTVSLEAEMVRAATARQDHAMALAVYRAASDIVRSALGRRG